MSITTASRTINAPVKRVFETIAHIGEYSKAIPHILNVEVLSEQRTGVGTRFVETRKMGKREASTELEVVEYQPPNHVRFVSESGGTLWDTVFTLTEQQGQTELNMRMQATAKTIIAKIVNLIIKGMVAKSIEEDMDAVKAFCESE